MPSTVRFPSSPIQEQAPAFVAALALAADPFPADTNRGPFVTVPTHAAALDTMRRWIGEMHANPEQPNRLGVLTGEEGSGKSRLLAELAHGIANDRLDVIRLPDVPSHRTDAQLLKAILAALGADPVGRTGLELRGEVRDILAGRRDTGVQSGLLIDDADFKGSQLELIHNLLRDTTGSGLWIILAGTPDLYDRMRRRRSLRGLMGPAIALDDIPATDLVKLVTGRINAVRTDATPDECFHAPALSMLADWAAGNPARMVRAASAAASIAVAEGAREISTGIARETVRQLTVAEANEARDEVAAATSRAVQAPMPLPATGQSTSSPATTQRSLWEGDESV